MKEYPFYSSVPKEYRENLKWRLRIREKATSDKKFQAQLKRMCSEDILFFFNGFIWLYEPRPRIGKDNKPLPTIIPFLTWEHQDPIIKQVDEALGFTDIGIEKSRGEGASWMAMMMILHRWLFFPTMSFGIVSKTELDTDNPDNPDSLFWKLDWTLGVRPGQPAGGTGAKLPVWMVPKLRRNFARHTLVNIENNSSITGYSAVGDVASGGRKTAFILDELAKFPRGPDKEALDSTGPVTESRFFISTPKGPEGAYYEIMHSDSEMQKLILDWKDNPTRNRGMFTIKIKRKVHVIEPVDIEKYGDPPQSFRKKFFEKDLKRLTDRGFPTNDENKWWSPWYVLQCLRPGSTPISVAQEYDRDYGGSVARFFNVPLIDKLITETTTPPRYVGELHWEENTFKPKFNSNPAGYLKIWCQLVQESYPPKNTDYVLGVDIAGGQGGVRSSNSVISVVNRANGAKVAELASPSIPPEMLADYAIALAMWFGGKGGGGHIIHEDMGYGVQFRNRIRETPFRNMYVRATTDQWSRKRSKKLGFVTTKNSKRELLGAYSYALAEGYFVNPSKLALSECKDYMILPNGRIEHVAAVSTDDPSGAGENHGDRVIADALANWVLHEFREGNRGIVNPLEAPDEKIPPTSILAMRREMQEKERKKRDYW